MVDELDLITGGNGDDTDDVPATPEEPEIVVTGTRITSAPVPGFSIPIEIFLPPPPAPSGSGESGGSGGDFDLSGGCGASQSEFREALSDLEAGSAAARAIIEAAKQNGLDVMLIREDITDQRNGYTPDPAVPNGGVLKWDPFSSWTGTNFDESIYTLSPVMILMHELIHWANNNLTEIEVISVANEIAKEMNMNLGTNFDTHRDRHYADSKRNVGDSGDVSEGSRPSC